MKKLFKEIAATGLLIALLTQASFAAAAVTFKVVQTPAVSVYNSQGASDTALTVTPVPVDLDGNVLTMSNFGSTPTITVDPGVSGYEEIESFSSIVNNGNNTATLGGISRDLQSVYPYTSAGTGKQHGGGAIVVFSNNPQIYGRLGVLENDQTWTGINTYSLTNPPLYNGNPTFTNPLSLISKAYADALTINGAPTSTFSGMGVVWLATRAQVGTGVASSTSGAPLVIPNSMASSTYNGSTVFQGEIPALRSTKDIDPNFIATSTGNAYVWGASHTFNSGFLSNASSTLNATTSIAASSVTNNALRINTVPLQFPSTQCGSGQTWVNNGSGVLTCGSAAKYTLSASSLTVTNGYATSSAVTVPAAALTASSSVTLTGMSTCGMGSSGGSCTYYLRTSTGVTIGSCAPAVVTSNNFTQSITMTVVNNNAVNAQKTITTCYSENQTPGTPNIDFNQSSSAVDFSQATGFVIVVQGTATGISPVANFNLIVQP